MLTETATPNHVRSPHPNAQGRGKPSDITQNVTRTAMDSTRAPNEFNGNRNAKSCERGPIGVHREEVNLQKSHKISQYILRS